MAQQIIIQQEPQQLQIAIVEDGRLAEYYLEQDNAVPVIGSIYRGTVERVMPGMQAAFVDIGWERSAYLALEDIVLADNTIRPNIADLLKAGQSLTVQIKKEAVDAKGPKLTTELSLQGRSMVLLPGKYQVNISKKITDTQRRKELKAMADGILLRESQEIPLGVIIRTAAKDCTLEELEQEFLWLYMQWTDMQNRIRQVQKPGLIAADQHMVARIVRDCAHENELQGIYVNDSALYESLQQQIPERSLRFKLHLREENLLEQFQLEGAIRTIHKRRVHLPSGAELVIDSTEAMNIIDVNTASFTGRQNMETTIVETNLEAAKEAAHQIRLRNLSGIILIDFIDMKDQNNQELVLQTLQNAFKRDRVKTNVHGISHLGLLEVTRQRTRAPLSDVMEQECEVCHGRGRIEKQNPVVR